MLYEKLHRPDAIWSVPDCREGDEVPAQYLAQYVSCVFPLVESAGREIPEGRLAISWLVDAKSGLVSQLELDHKCVVRPQWSQLAGDYLTVADYLVNRVINAQQVALL